MRQSPEHMDGERRLLVSCKTLIRADARPCFRQRHLSRRRFPDEPVAESNEPRRPGAFRTIDHVVSQPDLRKNPYQPACRQIVTRHDTASERHAMSFDRRLQHSGPNY